MSDYIKREDALNMDFRISVRPFESRLKTAERAVQEYANEISKIPAADVVAKGVYEQFRWERDLAVEQLASIGKGFGEKMDDVVERKRGEWVWLGDCSNEGLYCSKCKNKIHETRTPKKKLSNFCSNCGADMRGES